MFDSLADFSRIVANVKGSNQVWRERALERQAILTKPPGSLGRLEDVAIFLAGWGRESAPRAEHIRLVIFAGNHGVVAQGVSPYPSDVTAQMVANFKAGGAASNAITKTLGIKLDVVVMDNGRASGDITSGAALSDAELLSALNSGAQSVYQGDDVLVLGEMGIGNTTIAAALCARALGGTGRDWAGPGTGLDESGVAHKANVIDRALLQHGGAPLNAIETLKRVGGKEIAAIAGAVVAARVHSMPVVLDGYVVCASVVPLFKDNPDILAHCVSGHVSAEPAHSKLLNALSLEPLLNLGMRLGEGTGGVLACALLRAACATHNEMATFEEARVAGRVDE